MNKDLTLGAVAVSIVATWVVWSVYVIHSFVPPNPITLPFEPRTSELIHEIYPQGWGFFTKSPRDPDFFVFKQTKGKLLNVFDGPEAEPRNIFGFSRIPRAEGSEIGMMEVALPSKDLIACQRPVDQCLKFLKHVAIIKNAAPNPLLCGPIVLVLRPPIPWSWVTQFAKVNMPARLAAINVLCQ